MRVDLRSQRADLRPERADLRPGRGTNGMTDGRTNKSPPVFYRTSSPSGPLPLPKKNKARYTDTLVACGWAGAVMEKVTGAFGREQ